MIDSKNPSTYDRFRRPESNFHRFKYEEIFRRIGKDRKTRVVELGCGTGVYTAYLVKDFDFVFSSDFDYEMVRRAADRTASKFAVADALKIPVKSGSVDMVMAVSLLHHVGDREALFTEIRRILRPGGLVVFAEPNKLNPLTLAFQLLQTEDAISRFQLAGLMKRNGFDVVDMREILFRGMSFDAVDRMFPGYRKFEHVMERLHMGVTLLGIGKKA